MRLLIMAAIIAVGTSCVTTAETLSINPNNSVIVLEKANPVKSFAAKELAKHLKLITGVNIPIVRKSPGGKYIFYVGVGSRKLKPEESCYKITPKATWFYGDDKGQPLHSRSRTGTLFAVYNFLDRELGVKWIAPGDDGIVFKTQKNLKLSVGTYNWIPKLPMRGIRAGYNRHQKNTNILKQFHLSAKENKAKQTKSLLWLKRMRMGKGRVFGYGHAFTKWWEKYGKEHPEYFALNKYGKRAPWRASKPDRIKMCVSNPALQKKIVKNYLKNRRGNNVINTCENDSAGYCRCPKCKALDAPKKGEEFGKVMTDRYIWFANQVQRLARKKVPDTQAVMYAYSVYRFPPRKIKVDKWCNPWICAETSGS